MIDLIISATVGAIAGYGICAVMTVGRLADSDQAYRDENDFANLNVKAKNDAISAHARLADACLAKQARIDRALACETPKAAHGVKKMAAILRGEL